MISRKTLALLAVALAVVAFSFPAFAARGSADFTRFVTFGDSWGMGISNGSLVAKHQQFSWPAVIARQVGLDTNCVTDRPDCFQQPLVSEPGLPPELVLTNIAPVTITAKPGQGGPTNLTLARPYNNLSVSGLEVGDVLHVSGDGDEATVGPLVLRGLGEPIQQALAQNPTFIAIWLGGDDFFNAVQYGIARMTPADEFLANYNAMLDALVAGAPNAGMVVGTLPRDISFAPFVTLIPRVLVNPATSQPVLDPSGNPIPYFADLGGGTLGQLPAGSLVTLYARPYLATGYGIPPPLAPLFPTLPNAGKPLPDSVTLTPTELATISERVAQYNAAIAASAAAHNVPVVDIASFINQAKTGIQVGGGTGLVFNASFITGGLVSLDGFHLTDIGHTLFANEYIKTINSAYGTDIPVAPFTPLFAFNGVGVIPESMPDFDPAMIDAVPVFTPEALESMKVLMPSAE